MVEEDSDQSQNDLDQPTVKRAKRSRKSINDQSSATNSDEGSTKPASKLLKTNDINIENQELNASSTRTRQKSKQSSHQQLLAEQQRVEQRVQQEQLKLKQKELMQQHQQKLQEEIRQQQLRASNEDISNLRTNPNISMRELFPGEEEMGLHVHLPFANSWRTPDGWTKVTSTVQYDEATHRLWEELEKPYGNQSSFLRHLLLLEKFFRQGDLLLAQNANRDAISYAESVQHRLQAYDNIPPRAVSISQIIPQNTVTQTLAAAIDLTATKSTNTVNRAVTISKVNAPSKSIQPTAALTQNQKSMNDNNVNSLLKSNSTQVPRNRSYTVTTEPINGDKSSSTGSKTDLMKLNSSTIGMNASNTTTSTPKNKTPGLPPELICIATPNSNDKQTSLVPPPSYQLQMQLTLQQQIQQQHQNSLLLTQQHKQMLQNLAQSPIVPNISNQITPPKKQSSSNTASNSGNTNKSPISNNSNSNTSNINKNVIRLPDTLSEAERRESKQWRPTLMPITVEKNNTNSEIYQTADGRRLPYLVQVQSGGKPYMISIHDYNRMCILRRERLLRDQPELLKGKSSQSTSHANSGAQKSVASNSIANNATNATLINSIDVDKLTKSHNSNNSNSNAPNANKVQIPNKILEQNSLIPIGKQNENQVTSDSLLKRNKNQSSLLKSNAIAIQAAKSIAPQSLIPPNASVTATVVASNSTPKLPLSLTNALSHVSITSTPSISAILAMNSGTPSSTPPPIQLISSSINTQPITITNVTSLPSLGTSNQANVSALEALFKTTNQVTTTPQTMLQWAEQLNKSNSNNVIGITSIDNSPSSFLSKIPKSLTVIPQKRLSKGSDD